MDDIGGLYIFNHFFTGKNRISFYDLISSFNRVYSSFKREIDGLEKLDFGNDIKNIHFIDYYKSIHGRVLELYFEAEEYEFSEEYEDTCDVLYIREVEEDNNKVIAFIAPSRRYYAYKKRPHLEVNQELAKKYLDLFEKSSQLLQLYNILGCLSHTNPGIPGTFWSSYITTKICYGFDEFTYIVEGREDFFLDYFKISVILGEKLTIDLDNCIIVDSGEKIVPTEERCFNILKGLSVDETFFITSTTIWTDNEEEGKTRIKMLKDNLK